MTERYKTLGQTTLNGAINNSTTSVVVTSASALCGATFTNGTDTCRVRVDNEIMRVDQINTNTLTVTRGQEGTAAASHSDAATATQVVTAAALDQTKLDANIIGISGNSGSTALTSSFVGSGATTVYQDTGLQVSLPAAGTYLIIASALTSYLRGSATTLQADYRLHDGSAAIGGQAGGYVDGTDTEGHLQTMQIIRIYVASGVTTVKLQLARTADTMTGVSVRAYGDNSGLNHTNIAWFRLN